jgi:hypothetical protein
MSSVGLHSRDCRNRRFALCSVRELPPGASREVVHYVRRIERARRWRNISNALLLIAAVNLVFIVSGPLQLSGRIQFSIANGVLILAATMLGLLGANRARHSREAIAACIKAGICAACGYPLRAVKVDQKDGCRVCPECGAAWRG